MGPEKQPKLPEARRKELREKASFLEGLTFYRHTAARDSELTPELLEERERLSQLFVRGMYLLNYRKDFGKELFGALIRFQYLTAEEAEEKIYFALCVATIRVGRKAELKAVQHLKSISAK